MAQPEPMSDRRTIVLVIAVLTAALGVVVTVIAAISLQDPFTITGELGTRIEISGELIIAIVLGVLLSIGGVATATGLVRRQLRDAQH